MNLQIVSLWSPDLNPPSSGLPADVTSFDVFIQVRVGEVGKVGEEIFGCRVCSADRLADTPGGQFVNALVLASFDWAQLRDRIGKLLPHVHSCEGWDAAIQKLAPHLQYSDAE